MPSSSGLCRLSRQDWPHPGYPGKADKCLTPLGPEHARAGIPDTYPFGLSRRRTANGSEHFNQPVVLNPSKELSHEHEQTSKVEKTERCRLGEQSGHRNSKGTIKEGDELDRQGENTIEGDVENDTTIAGGINPRQRMRTNR
jgi:hypothetical protein